MFFFALIFLVRSFVRLIDRSFIRFFVCCSSCSLAFSSGLSSALSYHFFLIVLLPHLHDYMIIHICLMTSACSSSSSVLLLLLLLLLLLVLLISFFFFPCCLASGAVLPVYLIAPRIPPGCSKLAQKAGFEILGSNIWIMLDHLGLMRSSNAHVIYKIKQNHRNPYFPPTRF